jgi:hypothetical protein
MKLTKKGRLDKRFTQLAEVERRFWQTKGKWIVIWFMLVFAFLIAIESIFGEHELVSPKGSSSVIKVQEVQAKELERFCGDAISYIRCSGEALGRDNKTIRTMIEIARKESNFKPRAKNPKSTASGVFQITAGTWYSNDCVGDKWNFKDNIDCAWKIQEDRGFQPWEVWNKGLVQL